MWQVGSERRWLTGWFMELLVWFFVLVELILIGLELLNTISVFTVLNFIHKRFQNTYIIRIAPLLFF